MFKIPREVLQECTEKSPMQCKPCLFPVLDFEPTTEDGPFDIVYDSEKFVVVARPEEFMGVLFYQRAFSNFDSCPIPMKIQDIVIEPRCGEAAFKMACAATFGDWEVFKKAMYAETPKACKQTSRAIQGFVPAEWDAKAFEAMTHVQRWKAQNPEMFKFMKTIQGVAETALIPLESVHFFESTTNDNIWGTGVDTHPLKERILAIPMDVKASLESLHPEGKNQLGKALDVVFREISAFQTPEDYVASLDPACSLFAISEPIGRTLS
jgi:predicted NAD-dependent protein-ADP-ribosyltransferase YbiA (DUF1768 family)